jgi:hypothetical protein
MAGGAAAVGGIMQGAGSITSAWTNWASATQQRKAERKAQQQQKLVTGLPTSAFDPVTAYASLDALTQLGFYDPTILSASSPFNQALAQFSQVPMSAQRRGLDEGYISDVAAMIDSGMTVEQILASEDLQYSGFGAQSRHRLRALESLAATAGMSVQRLLEQEISHREAATRYEGMLAPIADQVLAGRMDALTELTALRDEFAPILARIPEVLSQLDQIPSLESVKGTELGRLMREIDEAEELALTRANVAGYNPAGALEGLEEARVDADLIAMQRAQALIGGDLSVITGELGALKEAERAYGGYQELLGNIINPGQIAASRLAEIRTRPISGTAGAITEPMQTKAPEFISAAGVDLGGALYNAGLNISQIPSGRAPAAPILGAIDASANAPAYSAATTINESTLNALDELRRR